MNRPGRSIIATVGGGPNIGASPTEEPPMNAVEPLTGAEWLARTLAVNGTSHVFFIDAVLRRTLIELGALGVTRVLAHAEKSAAYMADGYARIAGKPGI